MNREEIKKVVKEWAEDYKLKYEIDSSEFNVSVFCENITLNVNEFTFDFGCIIGCEGDEAVDLNDPFGCFMVFNIPGFSESLELYKAINRINETGFDFGFCNAYYHDGNVTIYYKEHVVSLKETLESAMDGFILLYTKELSYENKTYKDFEKAFEQLCLLSNINNDQSV